MKKLFSKALSLVLTLALLATLFCGLGVTASAESILETAEKAATKVYLIDFTDFVGGKKGATLVKLLAQDEVGYTGAEVKISYNYCLITENNNKREDEIFAMDWIPGWSGNNPNGAIPEDTTGQTYLTAGWHSYSASYTCKSKDFWYGFSKELWTDPLTNADLYIWNISITVDGEEVEVNPYSESPNVTVSVVSYEDAYNAQKACRFDLRNAASGGGFGYFTNLKSGNIGAVKGALVEVSFDYYLDTNSKDSISFENVGGSGHLSRTSFTIDQKEKTRLQIGTHSAKAQYTLTSSGFVIAFNFKNVSNSPINAEFMVWNITVSVANPKKDDAGNTVYDEQGNVVYGNARMFQQTVDFEHGYNPVSTSTNNNVFITIGSYAELMQSRKAYCLDYSMLAASGAFDGHNLCKIDAGTETEFLLSFKYKVVGAKTADAVAAFNYSKSETVAATGGDTEGSAYLLNDGREHYFEYKGVYGFTCWAMRLVIASNSMNPDLKVYVWDLIAARTDYNYNQQNLENNGNTVENEKPFTFVTYADVQKAGDKVLALDFAEAESEWNAEKRVYNAAKYALALNRQGANYADADITISFDYYLANASDKEIRVCNVAGGIMPDDKTGSEYLQPGRHSFSIFGKKLAEFGDSGNNLLLAVTYDAANKDIRTDAKLYIWNLTCHFDNGDVVANDAWKNSGIYDAGNNTYIGPKASFVSPADITENDYDVNNDGATNVLDLIRAKRVCLNSTINYAKENFGYAAIKAETLVEIKLAILAK